eukprot:scaffold55523_cov32-Tisochrysis_lutea.AAC.3
MLPPDSLAGWHVASLHAPLGRVVECRAGPKSSCANEALASHASQCGRVCTKLVEHEGGEVVAMEFTVGRACCPCDLHAEIERQIIDWQVMKSDRR